MTFVVGIDYSFKLLKSGEKMMSDVPSFNEKRNEKIMYNAIDIMIDGMIHINLANEQFEKCGLETEDYGERSFFTLYTVLIDMFRQIHKNKNYSLEELGCLLDSRIKRRIEITLPKLE